MRVKSVYLCTSGKESGQIKSILTLQFAKLPSETSDQITAILAKSQCGVVSCFSYNQNIFLRDQVVILLSHLFCRCI